MQGQKEPSAAFQKLLDVYFYTYHNDKRKKYHEENGKLTSAPIVFFGDSITDGCDIERWFPGLYAVNRGISGNTTRDLLKRMKVSVFDADPRLLVLLIGINDLMNEARTPEETAGTYRKILKRVKKECPDLPVICVSVYPGWDGDPEMAAKLGPAKTTFPIAYLAKDIVELNRRIREMAEEYGYCYADIHSAMKLEDDTMDPSLSYDGCHPNDAGYQVISSHLRPVIEEVLGSFTGRTIPIWGKTIPYNTGLPKAPDLHLHEKMPSLVVTLSWFGDVFGTKLMKDSRNYDTYTWNTSILNGTDSRNYDDVPGIIPYICKGSRTGIVVAPGGGFAMKSWTLEGLEIARMLNQNGISAFILDYRLNPYRAPAPFLDMQRAIRYVRYHAQEYGLEKDQIGCMGFSAGAYISGASAMILGDSRPEYDGYEPDEIDAEDGVPSFVGMIYPVVSFEVNINPFYPLVGEVFFNEEKRAELAEEYSLTNRLKDSRIPQFLCYGTKDPLKGTEEYGELLKEQSPENEVIVLEGANHGFGLRQEQYNWWADAFTAWVRERKR